jgi:hypothetical protein
METSARVAVRSSPARTPSVWEDVDIEGETPALASLADFLLDARGRLLPTRQIDPAPYSVCLAGIRVRTAPGTVAMAVDAERRVLEFAGAPAFIGILAENILGLAQVGDPG